MIPRMADPDLVVDADGHVLEHPDGMLRFAPAAYRERIWHVETKADGSEWLHYNGGMRPAGGMALAGAAGRRRSSAPCAPSGARRSSVTWASSSAPTPPSRAAS